MSDRTTPPVGPHLGDRISALVDDALPADARDRALVHVAGCAECRGGVESARLLKARLVALPTPDLPAGLTARLMAMADPGGPVTPRPDRLPGQSRTTSTLPRPGSAPPDRPSAGRPEGTRPAGRGPRDNTRGGRRTVRLAALGGAALSTMVLAVVGLSGAVGPATRVPAPVSQLTSGAGSGSGSASGSGLSGGAGSGLVDPIVSVSRTVRRLAPGLAVAQQH